jgi:hypothetical protein
VKFTNFFRLLAPAVLLASVVLTPARADVVQIVGSGGTVAISPNAPALFLLQDDSYAALDIAAVFDTDTPAIARDETSTSYRALYAEFTVNGVVYPLLDVVYSVGFDPETGDFACALYGRTPEGWRIGLYGYGWDDHLRPSLELSTPGPILPPGAEYWRADIYCDGADWEWSAFTDAGVDPVIELLFASSPEPSAPVILRQPEPLTLAAGRSGKLAVKASGGGLTYQWYRNGTALAGKTGSQLQFKKAAARDAGWYHCAITHANGVTHTHLVSVTVN